MKTWHPAIAITRARDVPSGQHPWRVTISEGVVLTMGNDCDDFCTDLREATAQAAGMNERLRP